MNETRFTTIAQLQDCLAGSTEIECSSHDRNDSERYAHISRVLKRFDYPRMKRVEQGVVLACLRSIWRSALPKIIRVHIHCPAHFRAICGHGFAQQRQRVGERANFGRNCGHRPAREVGLAGEGRGLGRKHLAIACG